MAKPYLIGISGGSGSGKTTFIRELRSVFKQTDLCIISQDDYYFPKEQQRKDANGVPDFDRPSSINSKEFTDDLIRLIS
ncbi:MAG TPA: uridine kinase, partial [Bacteroidetes bacterium]|nr:uridine kinase [Bacteroidota bacterium]